MAKRSLLASTRATTLGLASVVGLTMMTAMPNVAHADEVSPTGKGIIGGALLGGEVVTIPMSLAGVHAGWPYLVFGGLGMAGGAVGGWAVEQASDGNGQGPVYMLAGGLALVIPTLVLTLNATRYQPSENATEDHPPADTPAADPGSVKGSVVGPAAAPHSLLDIRTTGDAEDGLRVGLPLPAVKPMYTRREQADLGLPQHTEVKFPVVAVTF